jgi:hypothetical protein
MSERHDLSAVTSPPLFKGGLAVCLRTNSALCDLLSPYRRSYSLFRTLYHNKLSAKCSLNPKRLYFLDNDSFNRFEAKMSNAKSKKENSTSQFLSFDYYFYYYYFN